MYYKLWDYTFRQDWINTTDPPRAINWKTDVNIRLFPDFQIVTANGNPDQRGELQEAIFYGAFDGTTYSIPVVRRTFVYTRGGENLALYRDATTEWYYDDESLGPDSITRRKYYPTPHEQQKEAERKRANMVANCGLQAIVGQVLTGEDQATATAQGVAYWRSLVNEINCYRIGETDSLTDRITNDATPTWLNDVPSAWSPDDIRTRMLAEI